MKLAQQKLLNLLKVGAIICYLLLLLIHFDPKTDRSANTYNIINHLEYKVLVLGMFMVIIIFNLLVHTPIDVIDTVLLNPMYIPKRLRYRAQWKKAYQSLMITTMIITSAIGSG